MVQQQVLRPPSSCIRSISKSSVENESTPLTDFESARTRLSADAKSAGKGGQRQFAGLVDVYKKTLAADGVVGLYRGFVPSVVGICVYRGL